MNRRSIRFKNYNYAEHGWYFVTICTQNRERLFGKQDVIDTIDLIWHDLSNRFNDVMVDDWIVMPDHFHGIIVLGASNFDVGAPLVGAHRKNNPKATIQRVPTRGTPTLGDVVGVFKSITTNAYIHGVKHHNWTPFEGRLWQRNYHERVIRDEAELDQLREYIRLNPLFENEHSMYSKPIHN